MAQRRPFLLWSSIVFLMVPWSAVALTFISPATSSVFSSTLPNTISFSSIPTDPPLLDIYFYSSSIIPFGPTHLRLLASGVPSTQGTLTFTARGVAVLPPGDDYAVVGVAKGGTKAVAVSEEFRVVAGAPVVVGKTVAKAVSSATSISPSTLPKKPTSTVRTATSADSLELIATSISSGVDPAITISLSAQDALITPASAPGGLQEEGLMSSAAGRPLRFMRRIIAVASLAVGAMGMFLS